jgi:hypothetical protein
LRFSWWWLWRVLPPSGIWCLVVCYKFNYVLKECTACILRFQEQAEQATSKLYLLTLPFDVEDAGSTFIWNVSKPPSDYTLSHLKRQDPSYSLCLPYFYVHDMKEIAYIIKMYIYKLLSYIFTVLCILWFHGFAKHDKFSGLNPNVLHSGYFWWKVQVIYLYTKRGKDNVILVNYSTSWAPLKLVLLLHCKMWLISQTHCQLIYKPLGWSVLLHFYISCIYSSGSIIMDCLRLVCL